MNMSSKSARHKISRLARRQWRLGTMLLACLLSLTVLTAQNAQAYLAGPCATPASRVVAVNRLMHGSHVVMLGDSYLAGPGGSNPNSGGGCYRSTDSVGAVLTGAVGSMSDFTCTGAVSGFGATPAGSSRLNDQLSTAAVMTPDPDIVIVSIGGNDMHFSDVLQSCIGQSDCDPVSVADPTSNGDLNVAARNFTNLINATYSKISSTYPGAQVIVEAYPNLLPDTSTATAPGVVHATCLLDTGQAALDKLNALWKAVNNVIIAESGVWGFQPLDLSNEFKAHNVCSDNPLAWGLNGIVSGDSWKAAFHPNSAGQAVIANATRRTMRLYFTTQVSDDSDCVWIPSNLGYGYWGFLDAQPTEVVTSTISYELVQSTIRYYPE
jgi:lysophospholipase L1-like esterase